MLKDFHLVTKLSESLEIYERNFQNRIIPKFPAYKDFWEAFIGQRVYNQGGQLRFAPYETAFKNNVAKNDAKTLEQIYRRITMFHYGLFCDLAAILMKIDELSTIQAPAQNETSALKFRECFQDALSRFGNINNYFTELWNHVIAMKQFPATVVNGQIKSRKGKELINTIQSLFGFDFSKAFEKLGYINDARAFLDHWGQYPFQEINASYKVPVRIKGTQTWDEIHAQDKRTWISPADFLNNAYLDVVWFLNVTGVELIKAFEDAHGKWFSFIRIYPERPVVASSSIMKQFRILNSSSALATASGDGMVQQ